MALSGRIAILGYGSLIWDLDDLAPHVEGGWRMGAGPALPLEFSRISPKRLRSLVVVVDAEQGVPCATHAIASRRGDLAQAAADLAARERCGVARVGVATPGSDGSAVARRVARWCAETGAAGAVWASLPCNFEAETGRRFSVAAGLDYLRGLTGASAAEARRYIDGAPAATDTPLRRALAGAEWWATPPA